MTDDTTTTDESSDERPPEAVLDGLRAATTPIETTDPAADDTDLAPVGEALADARVVGLGEATHGSREFFQLKHRILQHLVTGHGVRQFAMEANLPETEALDDYVVHGDGDPAEALGSLHIWPWRVASVRSMLEWLREFNADRPLDDRVRVYGFDASYTHGAVARLREHLATADVGLPDDLAADLEVVDDEGEAPHQADDVPERVAAVARAGPRLRDLLETHRGALVAATSEAAQERAHRYVAVVEQASSYAAATDALEGDVVDADDYDLAAMERVMRRRDRAMADNVDWLLDHAGADQLVLWAHDGHLARTEQVHRGSAASATSLGGHLADRYGDDYRAVGFSFARGAFQAISEDETGEYALREQHLEGPLPGTVDATLAALDEPLAYVDLRSAAAHDAVVDWLEEPREHLSAGATFRPDDLDRQVTEYAYGEAFDAVCFVEETTRTRPLDGE